MDAQGVFHVEDWWKVIFTPSFPYRLAHMVCASFLTGSFVVAGVSAFHLWRKHHLVASRLAFSMAMWMALGLAPLQIALGDLHGRNTLAYQPIKVAAMEGLWETVRGAPMTLIAWPDMAAETNRFAIEIPHIASVYLTHSWNGEVQGLKAVPRNDWPYVPIVFFAFRIMVGIGMILLATAITGAVLRLRRRLFDTHWFQGLAMAVTPLGFVAVLAGWTTTEAGRQPWVIYGTLRTADAVAPVTVSSVSVSFAIFVVLYNVLLLAFLWFAARLAIRGPAEMAEVNPSVRPGLDRSSPTIVGSGAVAAAPRRTAGGAMTIDIHVLFAALVAFCVVVYVLADGFDLGVGILFLVAPRDQDRDLMMASIEPVWDGNETWLVMGGVLLLSTFPAGYYVLLPAFYLPVVFMLFALILRGVAFGFRLQTVRFRRLWDYAFAGGSAVAPLCQGFILGALIDGVAVRDGMFAGGPLDFFSLLGLLCGVGLIGGYACSAPAGSSGRPMVPPRSSPARWRMPR